jgi:hypothetical protein
MPAGVWEPWQWVYVRKQSRLPGDLHGNPVICKRDEAHGRLDIAGDGGREWHALRRP